MRNASTPIAASPARAVAGRPVSSAGPVTQGPSPAARAGGRGAVSPQEDPVRVVESAAVLEARRVRRAAEQDATPAVAALWRLSPNATEGEAWAALTTYRALSAAEQRRLTSAAFHALNVRCHLDVDTAQLVARACGHGPPLRCEREEASRERELLRLARAYPELFDQAMGAARDVEADESRRAA